MPYGFQVRPVWASNTLALVQLRCNVCAQLWSEMPERFRSPSYPKVAVSCPECGARGTVLPPVRTGVPDPPSVF